MLTDPTLTLVATTAVLPREGEVVEEHAKAASLERLVAIYRNREERILGDLRKRDETIADQSRAIKRRDTLTTALREDRDVLRRDLDERDREMAEKDAVIAAQEGQLKGRDETNFKLCRDLISLRSQLARAAAIEAAARGLRDHMRRQAGPMGWVPETEAALSRVDSALASPSPILDATGSLDVTRTHGDFAREADAKRRAAEARLAILERVAAAAKNFIAAKPTSLVGYLYKLQVSLAELDALEANQ